MDIKNYLKNLIFKNNEGGLMDVIRCDQTDYLVWKWRPDGQDVNTTSKENSIRFGSRLHVKDGEMCVFVYKHINGKLQDFITGPYEGTLMTANLPILTSIISIPYNGASPFQAEIYFFNLQKNNQLRFAIPYFDVADPRFLDFTVPVAVRGTITFNISDVKNFIKLNRLTDLDLDALNRQIIDMVKKHTKNFVTNCPNDNGISVLQLERKILEISHSIQAQLTPQCEDDFGINLKRIDISAIEIDKESNDYQEFLHATKEQQKIQAEQIGHRARIATEVYEEGAHLGAESQHIQAYTIKKQTEVLKAAANNLGEMGQVNLGGGEGVGMNPAGMMVGMGVAAGMGQQLSGMMTGINQQMQPPQMQQTPPPIPGSVSYMLAVNGQQYGPYNLPQLQQMAASGQLTAQTLVWCSGMTAWESAGSVPTLASIFGIPMPPTPPIPNDSAPQ